MFASNDMSQNTDRSGAAESSFITRNAATTAAVVVGATVPVIGTVGLMVSAPAQTIAIVGTAGTLAYVGHRQAEGLPIVPGRKADAKSDDSAPAAAAT